MAKNLILGPRLARLVQILALNFSRGFYFY